ncbi:hypothetical protein FOA52_004006 [Chlamydomonas sp. UWO 241]|nr:hypothetical protein FOA52_004006 [Chlamydomonas sp. UWO 241]
MSASHTHRRCLHYKQWYVPAVVTSTYMLSASSPASYTIELGVSGMGSSSDERWSSVLWLMAEKTSRLRSSSPMTWSMSCAFSVYERSSKMPQS